MVIFLYLDLWHNKTSWSNTLNVSVVQQKLCACRNKSYFNSPNFDHFIWSQRMLILSQAFRIFSQTMACSQRPAHCCQKFTSLKHICFRGKIFLTQMFAEQLPEALNVFIVLNIKQLFPFSVRETTQHAVGTSVKDFVRKRCRTVPAAKFTLPSTWRCSGPGWTRSWAASCGRCPCHWWWGWN